MIRFLITATLTIAIITFLAVMLFSAFFDAVTAHY